MAIFGLSKEWFENLTIETRPKRYFRSASLNSSQESGVTGSVYVFAERSRFEKEPVPTLAFDDSSNSYADDTVEGYRESLIASASLSGVPTKLEQVTRISFKTEDPESSLRGRQGTAGSFDYRNLLGHSSYTYTEYAYFDLYETSGVARRFYFYNSEWGDSKKKPEIPSRGSRHMIDLKDLSSLGDPALPVDRYDVSSALELVAIATSKAINSIPAFSASYDIAGTASSVTIRNTGYGVCQAPEIGKILNKTTGLPQLDLDLNADGIGDQELPTFPYNMFRIDVVAEGSSASIMNMMEKFLDIVNSSNVSTRKQTAAEIIRFEPSFEVTSNTLRKNVIKDILMPYYRTKYTGLHWGFTNYNTLNFFTSSAVPSNTALIYPSFTDETVTPSKIPYSPSGSFTFEFYINPRYTTDEVDSYASASFVVSDWEALLIDFYGGGRGAYNDSWNSDGNPVTDKGDEAPDYDFRTGDPIIKNCKITLNDGNGSGDQEFNFASPSSIHNASDWTICKNEVGDFDNYETAKCIAETIDNNQYFKSWAEKIEIVDEVGQQKVNEAGSLLWTDDNGLHEYSLTEALAKDGVPNINSYQATSAGSLLWTDTSEIFTAKSKGYGQVVRWYDSVDGYGSAAVKGYTGWYDVETLDDVAGPVDSLGAQRWVDVSAGDLQDYKTATELGYEGFYDSADPGRADNGGPADGDIKAWSEAEWAVFRRYRKFPITYSAAAWTEEAWADERGYSAAYLIDESGDPGTPGDLTTTLPAENVWMVDSGYTPSYIAYANETAWATGQNYAAVMTYEPTKVYGRVWVQTLVPGWAGNVATMEIETEEQTEFTRWAWEETSPDVWEWSEHTESSGVSEDARLAFRDYNNQEFEWGEGPVFTVSPAFAGGRDHIIVDRDKSHQFHAGTILHMSSSYAISLVTGSHIDQAGHPDKFRIMLQLSSSADIPPSEIPLLADGDYGDEKIFLSSDNSLTRNEWHHVAIRWGTETVDNGRMQMLINGIVDSEFNLDNSLDLSIPQEFGDAEPIKWTGLSIDDGDSITAIANFENIGIAADPAALFVGNFFEGKNAATYHQTVVYLDADGNPTTEGEHVAETFAWHVQEKFGDGRGKWIDSRGLVHNEDSVGYEDWELRQKYFASASANRLDYLPYLPVLSSTLAPDVNSLITEFGINYVYTQVLEIDSNSTQYIQGLFSYERAKKDGTTWGRLDDVDAEAGWNASSPDPLEPNDYLLRHPLNAEIHEIKIWNEYRSEPKISGTIGQGIEEISQENNLLFYLPPFFVKESRNRDVMSTPFQVISTTTSEPFNTAIAFGVGGHLLNLENFCREFVTGEYPILLNLSGTLASTASSATANELLYENPQIRKRNLTILPCDNGLFVPNFYSLLSGTYIDKPPSSSPMSLFVNDYGTLELSFVGLSNVVQSATVNKGLIAITDDGVDDTSSSSITANIVGASPENPGAPAGSALAILQRTRDTSSNEVVFFDASNLFYGKKINPGSYILSDQDVTGSGGKVKITLRDNGRGTLYRADASSKNATWASVGNLLYEEGIATVLNPCIPFFGKEQFEIRLEGFHSVHTMEIMIPCQEGMVNSSSNPNYQPLKASTFASDQESEFVYITGLNFHDENLNVIARTNLAQPVTKRDTDSVTFRIKVDF